MGKRLQPRIKAILPVRIWGNDNADNPFVEHVCTVDISNRGVALTGVRPRLSPGSTIGLQYRHQQARFRIIWVRSIPMMPGQSVGLVCLEPNKEFWPVAMPHQDGDSYVPAAQRLREEYVLPEVRVHTRYPVSGAARVRPLEGNGGGWTKLADLSLGGCYLETGDVLEVGRSVRLLIKTRNHSFEAVAVARSSCPGIGMGLEFTFLTNADRATLRTVIGRLKDSERVSCDPAGPPSRTLVQG